MYTKLNEQNRIRKITNKYCCIDVSKRLEERHFFTNTSLQTLSTICVAVQFFAYARTDLDVLHKTRWQLSQPLERVNIVYEENLLNRHFGETVKKCDACIDFLPACIYFDSQNSRRAAHTATLRVFAQARKHCLTQMSLYTSNNALAIATSKTTNFTTHLTGNFCRAQEPTR
jgi:hypothetical protein